MNRRAIVLSTVFLVLALGVVTPQFAQDTFTNLPRPDLERHVHILGLLRTINTSEVTYQSKYGLFGTWQALLSNDPKYFEKFLAINGLLQANVQFGEAPEVLPGLNLRMNVHTDGQGYDLLLEDTTDKEHYGALSDERGVIRECKPLQ